MELVRIEQLRADRDGRVAEAGEQFAADGLGGCRGETPSCVHEASVNEGHCRVISRRCSPSISNGSISNCFLVCSLTCLAINAED